MSDGSKLTVDRDSDLVAVMLPRGDVEESIATETAPYSDRNSPRLARSLRYQKACKEALRPAAPSAYIRERLAAASGGDSYLTFARVHIAELHQWVEHVMANGWEPPE